MSAVPTTRPLLVDLVRSEWTKLWSVRSTPWAALAMVAAMTALAAVFAATGPAVPSDPVAYGLSGFFQAQLGAAVLGALPMTSEYATGSIRATLTACPQRIALLSAKTIVVAGTAAATGIAAAFGAFVVAARVYDASGISIALTDPGAVRAVIGAGLYLAVLAVLALALGTVIRSSAGTIAAVVALMLVLPGITGALPAGWRAGALSYLPGEAGQALIGHTRFAAGGGHPLTPWTGFAVLCAYAVVGLAGAAIALIHRDSG